MVIAYNDVTSILNSTTIINVLFYSFIITFVIVLFIFSAKYLFRGIFPEKEYYNSSLLEELTYLYMNYNEYEPKFK